MTVGDAEQPELQNRFVFVDHKFIFLLFKVWYFASKHNFQEIRNGSYSKKDTTFM